MSIAGLDPQSILSKVELFTNLSREELDVIAHRTITHRVPAGHLIFSEGDACEGLFVVASGTVKIFKTGAGTREQILAMHHSGDAFAELPVFDGGPYPASAMAMVDATLLFVSKSDFRTLCLEHPEIALKVLKAVGLRLRRLVMLVEELSFTTVRSRLISLLLRLARTEGKEAPEGTLVHLGSNQELAAQIGTVRELVSRNLSRLQNEELIRLDGKDVVITDVEALEKAMS